MQHIHNVGSWYFSALSTHYLWEYVNTTMSFNDNERSWWPALVGLYKSGTSSLWFVSEVSALAVLRLPLVFSHFCKCLIFKYYFQMFLVIKCF